MPIMQRDALDESWEVDGRFVEFFVAPEGSENAGKTAVFVLGHIDGSNSRSEHSTLLIKYFKYS